MGVCLVAFPFFAFAAVDEYSAFSVRGVLGKDGALSVDEQFIYDYGNQPRHGLYRNIPLILHEDGLNFDIQSVAVTNQDGTPYQHETAGGGNIAQIKIGSPNITLTGTHYYNLTYTLVGIGGLQNTEWRIANPMKEHIAKFQADIFFPLPIPQQLATGTCAFLPDRNNSGCKLEPLLKKEYVLGYRIAAENINEEEITVTVGYPKGLISPRIDAQKQTKAPRYLMPVLLISVILLFTSGALWFFRKDIMHWLHERKKPIVHPGEYSYLTRAIAYNNKIARNDVVATIADLAERGYLMITPYAHPVGLNEFVDYSVEVLDRDTLKGAEAALVAVMDENISSLADWITKEYPSHAERIVAAATSELENIRLLKDEGDIPWPMGFK